MPLPGDECKVAGCEGLYSFRSSKITGSRKIIYVKCTDCNATSKGVMNVEFCTKPIFETSQSRRQSAQTITQSGVEIMRFLDINELANVLGITAKQIRRMWVRGQFPPPFHIPESGSRWSLATVEEWQRKGCPIVDDHLYMLHLEREELKQNEDSCS